MSSSEAPPFVTSPAHKAAAAEQPEITVVNINAETRPTIFRCTPHGVSDPRVLDARARFLEAEDALLVSVTLSPQHLAVVAALQDGWVERFQRAVQVEWPLV